MKRKSADITARMSRSEVAEAQAKARAAAFVWPAPPYYEFSDPAAAADGADCLLMFRDGPRPPACCCPSCPKAQAAQVPRRRCGRLGQRRLRLAASACSCAGRWRSGARRFAPTTPRSSIPRPNGSRSPCASSTATRSRARPSAACTRCAACSCFRRIATAPSRAGSCPRTRPTRPASASRSAKCWWSEKLATPEAVDAALSQPDGAALAALRRIPDREPDRVAGAARRGAQAAAQPADPEARRDAGRARLPHRVRARRGARHRGARPLDPARPDPRRHGRGRRRGGQRGDRAQARHPLHQPEDASASRPRC